jgi:hypothetical protein
MSEPGNRHWHIDSSRIPVRGGIGTALLIALLLAGMLVDLPGLRSVALGAGVAGVVFGVALILWRR